MINNSINTSYTDSNRNWKTLIIYNIFLDGRFKDENSDMFRTLMWNDPFKNYNFTIEKFQNDCFPILGINNLNALDESVLLPDMIDLLKQLKHFRCGGRYISDLSPLSSLENLMFIDCREADISDLSPLSNLKKLDKLYISNTKINTLQPIWDLTIKEIRLGFTKISKEELHQYYSEHPNCIIKD